MTYLAYVHARPNIEDASGIFYVGKGRASRAHDLKARNNHHGNVVAKYGAKSIITGAIACSNEEIAFDLERGLIKCLRRMGVELTNQTDGGDGVRNLPLDIQEIKRQNIVKALASPEVRQKMSVGLREAKSSAEARLRMSQAAKYKRTPEMRAAMSNRVITQATKTNMSISALARCDSPEWKRQHSQRMSGRIWVNDGLKNRRSYPDEIAEGFVRGMLPSKSHSIKCLKET